MEQMISWEGRRSVRTQNSESSLWPKPKAEADTSGAIMRRTAGDATLIELSNPEQ